jgi:hypothetical protein
MGRLRDRSAILDEDLVNAVKIGAIDVARSRRSVSEWLTGTRGGLNRLVAGRIRAVGGHPRFFGSGTDRLLPDPRISYDTAINRIFALLAQLWLRLVVNIINYNLFSCETWDEDLPTVTALSRGGDGLLRPIERAFARPIGSQ